MDATIYEDICLNREYNFARRKVAKNKKIVFLLIKVTLKPFLEEFLVRLLISQSCSESFFIKVVCVSL